MKFVAACLLGIVLTTAAGCPAPTPKERILQLGGIVTEKGDGAIDLDLSGTATNDNDVLYVMGICSNSGGAWKEVHVLNLSGTKITDHAIELFVMNKYGRPPKGLRVLILRDTEISEEAIADFSEAVPGCSIIRSNK